MRLISHMTLRGWHNGATALFICVATLLATALSGCGKSAVEAPTDAPAFTTADALVAHLNGLITRDPFDLEGVWSLYYIENDLQQRYYDLDRQLWPFTQFNQQVWNRFGEGLMENETEPPLAPMASATIVERSDRRARATTTTALGETLLIELVEVGGGWRVSGYTLERLFDDYGEAGIISAFEWLIQAGVPAAQSLSPRMAAGEFATIADLRKEWHRYLQSAQR